MKLIIKNLSKTYPNGTQALKNVELEITSGMFGLLGPNGAGKSTLMRTIATLQEPDSGSISLEGLDVLENKMEVRRLLGYLPQEFGVYPNMTAVEMLDHFAVLKGISNSKERKETVKMLLEQTNLFHVRKKKLGGYSGGMKQRFGIAQALLGNPQLVIVDEPTAGLDPAERRRFHNLLSEIGQNIIIILSTHIVDDVSDLCENMAIINKGEVLLSGRPLELMKEQDGKFFEATVTKDEVPALQNSLNVISTRLFGGKVNVRVQADQSPDGFQPSATQLEDIYFAQIKNREANQIEA